jgi:dihydroorotase
VASGTPYDLLLKGGGVIDPAQSFDSAADVGFKDGRVAALERDVDPSSAERMRDVTGQMVVPGLIDLHTHVYWGGTSCGVDAGELARRSGTTTLVDAGSSGPGNFPGFKNHVVDRAPVRILCFLNISFAGIYALSPTVMVGEAEDIRLLSPLDCLRVAREHSDLVVGVKVRVGRLASGSSGVAPLRIALEVAEELGLPVMAHVDLPPPDLVEVLEQLRAGDVLTHCFRPFPNAPIRRLSSIREDVREGRERGIVFDIGHGVASFAFDVAAAMLDRGFPPDVISSDAHVLSVAGPAHDLLVTMSKFLHLGMPVAEIIQKVTAAPAKVLRRAELGTLQIGAAGDATVLEIVDGRFDLLDATGTLLTADRAFALRGMVIGGVWTEPGADDRPTIL